MTPQPLEVFYSYSHKDEELRDQLENHLSMLKRETVINGWHDRRIIAGQEWNDGIDEHLNLAHIILLLVSSDFLASNYCYDIEIKRAMERHEARQARVIPIILRSCDWHNAPFGKLKALPKDGKPVTRWKDRDEAFVDIARGIRTASAEIHSAIQIADSGSDEPSTPAPQLQIPDILRVAFVARIDRDEHDIVQRLKEELAPKKNRLIALWGAGGVGKTALAVEVVRGLVDDYRQRVVWVSADGREEFSATTLFDEIATQLGNADLRKLPTEAKKEQVRKILIASPTLVVLDNFETIAPAEGINCAGWLAQPSLCSTLITTRQNIRAAHRNIPVETMLPNEAETLLRRSIAEAHDQNAFANFDRKLVLEVSEANPLVLQWIVRQIDLAQDAGEVLNDLRHGEGPAAERVFNRSFELRQLDNGGRAVLLALSMFVPSATRKALSEVAGLDRDKDRKRFRDSIKTLSSLWLLQTAQAGERLAVEGLTRELTKARLIKDPRSKTIRPRFVGRFLRYSRANVESTAEHLDMLEAERENILAAIDVAVETNDWTSTYRIAYAFWPFLKLRGYWDEAIRRGVQAMVAARNAKDEYQIGVFANNVGDMHMNRGDYAQAKKYLNRAVAIAKQLNAPQGLAATLDRLAYIALSQGDIEQARISFNESLDINKRINNQGGISSSLFCLAMFEYHQGNIEAARQLSQESFEISKQLDDQLSIAASLAQLAELAQHNGKFDEANQLYDNALNIWKRHGDLSNTARIQCSLGRLFHDQGALEKARGLYQSGLETFRKLRDQDGIAVTLHELGLLYLDEDELQGAENFLQESLEILKSLAAKTKYAECLESVGKLRVAQGQLDAAEALYDEALELARLLGLQFRIASVKWSLGLLAEKRSEVAKASRMLQESVAIFEKLGSFKVEEARRDLERVEVNRY